MIAACPPLDTNSAYCNLLQCTDFADFCVAAAQGGQLAGWVSGYRPPAAPGDFFIWQVAVAPAARGQGLASRMIEDFQTVPPGAPTVRVASIDRLEAVVSIPESEARDFREGQIAEFSLPQEDGKPVIGKLKSIDRAVEARNRTVTARIEIANAGNALRPGMVGRARILRRKYDRAVVIPSQAVLRLQEGTKVMLARAGKAVEAAVRLGPAAGDNVIVESGIAAGDTLITTGAFQVSNGTKISY